MTDDLYRARQTGEEYLPGSIGFAARRQAHVEYLYGIMETVFVIRYMVESIQLNPASYRAFLNQAMWS